MDFNNSDGNKCTMCRTIMDLGLNSDAPVVKTIQCPTHKNSKETGSFNDRTGSLF